MTTLHAFLADVDATEQVGQALAATPARHRRGAVAATWGAGKVHPGR
ncbi:hypothetical protein I4I65_00650, partial [Xanthomonas campestris pv. campestris]|nr:hypothetical protein [Xanthomonas campestris pv. campestris]